MGTEKSKGYGIFSLSGHVDQARPVRGAARHHAARADRPRRRHPRGPRAEVLDARRLHHAAADRRAPRRARSTSRASARPARCSAPARCRSSTRPPAWSARCCAGPSSTSTSPAASAPRAARAPGGWCRPWPGSSRAQGSEADLDLLLDQCDNILGRSFCALGDGATSPITSSIQYFRDEYLAAPRPRRLPVRPGRLHRSSPTSWSHGMTTDSGASRPGDARRRQTWSSLTIDGIEVSVPKDTLVIRAAEQVGVQIPRFCDHPLLAPGRRLPPVPGRHPRRRQRPRLPQAAGLLHAAGRRGHGRQHPGHLRGRRQGAAGRHGVPADQPPARLPGLRQGRRVPAAEPGDVQRPRRVPVLRDRRRQAHLPQADQHLRAGAARPRALRAVRALHPLLRADRRRPVHRADRARCAAAGRHLREGAVRVSYFSGNTIQICPVGALTSADVPLPLAPVRPGLHARRSPSTTPAARRSASTTAAAR